MDVDGSAKILTNAQTFRDCALHQGNALNIPLMNDFGTSINVHHFISDQANQNGQESVNSGQFRLLLRMLNISEISYMLSILILIIMQECKSSGPSGK